MKDILYRILLALFGIGVICFLFWLANCGVLNVR